MSEIEIDIHSKTYPSRAGAPAHEAIAGLRLTLKENEFVCLVGPSGCGKTTLLNLIAGLDQDYEGRIDFNLSAPPIVGYLFQEPRLLPWRTVRQNLSLALPPARDPAIIDEMLDMTGLTPFQHVYPQRLSLGMSRRVALARAFSLEPHLLLMDEPFVSLDAQTADKMRALLLRLWQHRPHSVLFVTHDLREAITLADRVVFLTPPPSRVKQEITLSIPRAQRSPGQVESMLREIASKDIHSG